MAIDHERRTHPRIQPERGIYVEYPDLRPRVRDISLTGAFIEDNRPLSRGRMLNMTFWLDEQTPVTARAMVRRAEEGVGMGVEFLSMSNEDRNRLRQFVGISAQVERLQSF
ncbi:MAG: PilZ domain-containing protein [Terriglobia bacterium]